MAKVEDHCNKVSSLCEVLYRSLYNEQTIRFVLKPSCVSESPGEHDEYRPRP